MKRILSLALSFLMLLSLFTFVSCDEQTISDAADIALAIIDSIPEDTENTEEANGTTETVPVNAADSPSEASEETAEENPEDPAEQTEPEPAIDENGSYDDKDNVALYIHTYGKLPPNYITKAEAEDLGWEGGSVERYAEGKCIGGSKFGNYEGLLPKKDGRQYYECDIDTLGEDSRGAKRIVYSNDGLIYYTDDHYETFELLYGEE